MAILDELRVEESAVQSYLLAWLRTIAKSSIVRTTTEYADKECWSPSFSFSTGKSANLDISIRQARYANSRKMVVRLAARIQPYEGRGTRTSYCPHVEFCVPVSRMVAFCPPCKAIEKSKFPRIPSNHIGWALAQCEDHHLLSLELPQDRHDLVKGVLPGSHSILLPNNLMACLI